MAPFGTECVQVVVYRERVPVLALGMDNVQVVATGKERGNCI